MNNNKRCFRIVDGDKSVSNTHYWFDAKIKPEKYTASNLALKTWQHP